MSDAAWDNGAAVPGAEGYLPRWRAEAAAFRAALGGRARLGLSYGATPREKTDLFLPEGAPEGLVIFVHGGYWRSRHRHDWSHLAAGALAAGQAVAMPSYMLAPAARISRITRQIALAVEKIAREVPGPIRLAGHSAGGHLVARMLCADAMFSAATAERIARCMPISPVADLRPLLDLEMNADLRLTPAEALVESPALLPRNLDVPVTVAVGGAELAVFRDQARGLAGAWGAELLELPGRHHFDVIDGLAVPGSVLLERLLG